MSSMKNGQEVVLLFSMVLLSLLPLIRLSVASALVDDVREDCFDDMSGEFGTISNLQAQIDSSGVSLAVLNGNSLVQITQKNEILRVTGDVNSLEGLVDGPLRKARFQKITSFLQLNSTFILVVDSGNKCIRSVDMRRGIVDTFSGYCSKDSVYSQYESVPGGRFISYLFPYHLVSDPTNRNVAFLTDHKYVRHIDINTRYATIVFDHAHSKEDWMVGAPTGIPSAPWELRWMAFSNHLIYITTKSHGLLILNQDWLLIETVHPERFVAGEGDDQLMLNHIYALSPEFFFITFVSFNGWFRDDPKTLVFDAVNPDQSSVLEDAPQLRQKLGLNFRSIGSISWMNRQLIFAGDRAWSRSQPQLECLQTVSVSFTGSALNNTGSDVEVSTAQTVGSLKNATNDKETVTQEKTTSYAKDSTVSSRRESASSREGASSSSNDGTSMHVFPIQTVTIKQKAQYPTTISAQKGSAAYPKYPDNRDGASSIISSSDGNFIESNSAVTSKVTLPFTNTDTGIPNGRSLSPNNNTTIESNTQPMVKMPGIGDQIGIITSVSVVLLVITALSIGFVCYKHYLQRSIKSDRHEQPSIELHNLERVLPGIPDDQIGADEIYEQINPDEHYYSTITESTVVNNDVKETQGPTVVTLSQGTSILGSPRSIYVLNATRCDERDV